MAIAYDNSTSIANWSASNPATGSHTCTGSDLILFVAVFGNSTMTNVSATYNGVSMTRLSFFTDANGNKNALFYLVNPATGSNTVSVTRTGGANLSVVASSYTGVDQTTPIDASRTDTGNGTGTTSYTTGSITVGSSDNWLLCSFRDTDNRVASADKVSFRVASSVVYEEIWDSNGTVSSGAQTITFTITPSGRIDGVTTVSLAAATAGGAPAFIPKIMFF